ncbi:Facilitated trehalose transporter Tret1-2-like protein [Armadillidium vulgare]|nr:Facilitated trehalose transporter Tret1-2-like protein [Armadillidium vulgare]
MASLFGAIFDSFRLIALACAIPSTVGWFFMIFAKESPYYLLSLKKEREAEDSFSFFRGKKFSGIQQEIEDLKTSLEEKTKLKTRCLDLFKKTYRKPLLICLGLMSFRQLMGINALIFNMAAIFKETGTTISSNLASVIVFSAQMLGTGIEIFTVDLKGRKILLQISASVMGTSCGMLNIFSKGILNASYKYINFKI